MKTIYLHIGTPKTGTSSLQSFLHVNRNELYQQGYLVPKCLGFPNHISLADSCRGGFKNDALNYLLGVHSVDEWNRFTERNWDNLVSEISALPNHDVILSSEVFYGALHSFEQREMLRLRLENCGCKSIKVILYLREQADFVASYYSTDINFWGSIEINPPRPSNPNFSTICDYRSNIIGWSEVYGEENLDIRLFPSKLQATYSVIDDFMERLPNVKRSLFRDVPRQNQSISSYGLTVIRRVNEELPFIVDGMMNPLRKGLGRYVQKHFPGPAYRMPEDLRREYILSFNESNEWVRSKYFPQRSLLFDPVSSEENPNFVRNHEADAMCVIAYLKRRNFLRNIRMRMLRKWKSLFSFRLRGCPTDR